MKIIHLPVLTGEILEMLQIKEDGIYMDGTLGDGGHAEQILSRMGPRGLLVAFDQDKDSISFAKNRLKPFESQTKIIHDNFKNIKRQIAATKRSYRSGELTEKTCQKNKFLQCNSIKKFLKEEQIGFLDGILLDIGVSSRQLENPERGFSFSSDTFLDMRMDQRTKTTAFDLVNNSPENELCIIFKDFGEERWAKRIARAIVRVRKEKPIRTTGELNKLILSVVPAKSRKYKIHPATRVFQALRIAVNKELEALSTILDDGIECLKPSGRFCVISFHSLEDRLVKNRFRQYEKGCICPTEVPYCVCGKKPVLRVITKKPIVPTEDEVKKNPRARSAKLRVAEKIG